jgi:hypothetical protein
MSVQQIEARFYAELRADRHPMSMIAFHWYDCGSMQDLQLRDRTYNEAMRIAKEFGYKDRRWFDPRTWSNCVIVTE